MNEVLKNIIKRFKLLIIIHAENIWLPQSTLMYFIYMYVFTV